MWLPGCKNCPPLLFPQSISWLMDRKWRIWVTNLHSNGILIVQVLALPDMAQNQPQEAPKKPLHIRECLILAPFELPAYFLHYSDLPLAGKWSGLSLSLGKCNTSQEGTQVWWRWKKWVKLRIQAKDKLLLKKRIVLCFKSMACVLCMLFFLVPVISNYFEQSHKEERHCNTVG